MGIYSLRNIKRDNGRQYLFELEVNGQTVDEEDDNEYTIDDTDDNGDDEGDDNTPQSPEDIANQAAETDGEDDYTIRGDDVPEDNLAPTAGPTVDAQASDPTAQPEDDFTIPADDDNVGGGDDAPAADNANVEDGAADDVDGTTNADTDQQTQNLDPNDPQNAGGGEQVDDFTISGDDVEGGEGDDGAAEGGGGSQDAGGNAGGGDDSIDDPSQELADEEQKAAEEELYSSLTSDQRRIRSLYLKTNYKNLYDEYQNVISAINDITKTSDNIEVLKRTTTCMLKNKDNLVAYVSDIFDSSSYIDNFANYIKFVAILRTVTRVLKELNEDKNIRK